MRQWILFLVLMASSTGAVAAWVRVGSSQDVLGSYADPASVRKSGRIVKMTSLLDFRTPQHGESIAGPAYFSKKDQQEYDCKGNRYRLLHTWLRADHMNSGKVVRRGHPGSQWVAVVPGSLGEALWRFACVGR